MHPDPTQDDRVLRFGEYVIDVARRELSRAGVSIDVQPRVFDLLLFLASNHGRAVSKDELQAAVWPGMFISDTALTRAVMKARKAVGDDANRQTVIKTVHSHGYRFIADLAVGSDTVGDHTPPATPDGLSPAVPAVAAAPRRWLWPAMLAGLLVTAAVVFALSWRSGDVSGSELRIAVLPLEDASGDPELAWTRLGLMSYVSQLLEADEMLSVVADGSVVSLADSLGWAGGLDQRAAAPLLEKLRDVYGASHILAMELRAESTGLRMNFGLLGPDGKVQRGTMVGDSGTALAEGVVQSLYGMLVGRRRQVAADVLVSADPFNNEAFARGMDLSLQGRCAEALSFFDVVVRAEPGLFAPRFEYASCQRVLGQSEAAEALLLRLVEEQRALGPGPRLAQALMTLGVLYNRSGRLAQAEASHREALAIAESAGEQELAARILQNLSIVHEDRGEYREAESLLDLAVLAYQAAGRESMPGHLYSARANLCMDRGELAEARQFLEQALAAFRQVGDKRNEAMMLNNTGYLLRQMGRLEEAEGYHLRSLEMREAIGDRVGVGRVYSLLSALYTAQGRYAEAAGAAEAALAVARDTRDRLFEGTSLAQLADAEEALGRSDASRRHLLASREVFVAIEDRMRVQQVDLRLARLDLAAGALDAAEIAVRQVLAAARERELIQPEVEAMELLGEIALVRKDLDAAIAAFTSALERVRASSWAGKEGQITVHLLNALLDAGEVEAAAPTAGALAGLPPTTDSLLAQARYAGARGHGEQALVLMEQAKALAGAAWGPESEARLLEYRGKPLLPDAGADL